MTRFVNSFTVFVTLSMFSYSASTNMPFFDESVDEPLACLSSSFSQTSSSGWHTIALKITNGCGVAVDFTNTRITFKNANILNTPFWGNFTPLSYPDNDLQITSSPTTGGYLATLLMHIPEASWANRLLKPNEFFTIIYGAPTASYDPASVKVYVRALSPPAVGSLTVRNNSSKPATISQNYAVVKLMLNNQPVSSLELPWLSQVNVPNLAPNTYVLMPERFVDNEGKEFVGTASPSSITIVANQASQATISYSQLINNGQLTISSPSLPDDLRGYTESITISLAPVSGSAITRIIPWNAPSTIGNLVANTQYTLAARTISFNGKTCIGRFEPSSLTASAGTPPNSRLTFACAPNSRKRLMAYAPGWKTPPQAASLAAAGYTHVLAAFGVFSTTNPGEIVNAFDSITKQYINELHQAGLKVILSLGGASSSIPNTSVDFHQVRTLAVSETAFRETFIASLSSILSAYGFDGFDIDIEHGLVGSGSFSAPTGDISSLAAIINTLHQQNPALLITLTPQVANISATSGFDATWGNYASLVMQTASALDYVGVQIYNTGCAHGIDHICYADEPNNPDLSVAMAAALLENWPQSDEAGRPTGFQNYVSKLTDSQVVLGYPAPNRQGISDGLPVKATSVIKRVVQCLRTAVKGPTSCNTYVPPRAYPNFGGVFEWEVSYDQDNNFKFATDLKECVLNNNC